MSSYQPSPNVSFTDKHTIETPEQMRLEFACAGIGSRFLALAIDSLIQAGATLVLLVLGLLLTALGFLSKLPQAHLWGLAVLIAGFFLLYFGYFAWFEIFWRGQTPGKRAIGIRVIKETGRPLSPTESIARNLLRIVDQLPGFYGVGVLAAMLNAQNRRLGDYVAGSIVIRENSFAEVRPEWQDGGKEFAQPRLGAEKLSSEELALIDAFLSRRHDLEYGVRSRMAREILGRLEEKLALNAQEREDAESTLKRLAVEARSSGGY
jgi:uncharacterized RDD family membrane protein YckC